MPKKTKSIPDSDAEFAAFLEDHGLLGGDAETPSELVLELLAAQGDELTQIREIDFFAYLPTAQARASYIDKCLAAGFQLRSTSEPDKYTDRYGAIVFHNDAPDGQTMEKIWELLSGFAEECGGNFDGWETQVMD